ncbi:MAG TPA: metalloregulator ArsR/SmtB family transcription factor [Microthrixaceae bacterium]|nr:metalloregulator ArsR/SmtB family transcription factor [Microthrixaceae bacterium]
MAPGVMGIRVSTMATNTTPLTVRSDETAECCPALLAEPLDPTDAVELAAVFKALADPVRLQLLSLIAAAPNATACSCDLEEPVGKSQPTVSHHLSVLADAGLITKEKVGRWVNCTIVADRLAQVRAALES